MIQFGLPVGISPEIPITTNLVQNYDAATASSLLNASSLTAQTNDPISQWSNLASGSYNMTQATSANRPTKSTFTVNSVNLPVVAFDGSNDQIDHSVSSYTDMHLFWIGAITGTVGNVSALLHGSGGNALNNFQSGFYWYQGSDILQAGNLSVIQNNWMLVEISRTSGIWSVFVNGVSQAVYLNSSTTADIYGLGKSFSGNFSKMSIGQWVMYSSALSGNNLTITRNYLKSRWGFTY